MSNIETLQCAQNSSQQETKAMEMINEAVENTGASNAMTPMSLFNFDGFDVRIQDDQGKPWFVAKEVCKILGYKETRRAVSMHCKGGCKMDLPSRGGIQETTIIPESDVYRLIMRSKLPAAERFEDWVTSEVLPTIRKTGSYDPTLIKALNDSTKALNISTEAVIQLSARNKDLQRETTVLQEKTETLRQESEALKQEANENRPQLEAYKRLAGSKGTFSLTEAAKTMKAPPRAFSDWLAANGWIYKRSSQKAWLGYQTKTDKGLLTHTVTELPRISDIVRTVTQVRVTPLGMTRIALLLEKKPLEMSKQAAA